MENQSKESGISLEEKVSARYERSKCLKESYKQSLRRAQKKLESQGRYEIAFHEFVNSQENYMKYEKDAEKRELMSYN